MSNLIDFIVDRQFSLQENGYNINEVNSFLIELCKKIKNIEDQSCRDDEASFVGIESTSIKSNSIEPDQIKIDDENDISIFSLKEYKGGWLIEKYTGFDNKEIVIPSYINGRPVYGICEGAFQNANSIVSVFISAGIEFIGSYCFEKCSNLVHVSLSNTIKAIGASCFSKTSLQSIVLPDSLLYFGQDAFRETPLKHIKLSNSLRIIPKSAFYLCRSLKSITIPEGVVIIDSNAFDGCKDLVNIVLPNGLKCINAKAFCDCNSLSEIDIPPTVVEIEDQVFTKCRMILPDLRYNPRFVYENLDINILCKAGSIAQEYARRNGLSVNRSMRIYTEKYRINEPIWVIDMNSMISYFKNQYEKFMAEFGLKIKDVYQMDSGLTCFRMKDSNYSFDAHNDYYSVRLVKKY